MTSPLRRIAAGLSLLAAAFLLVAALLPTDANAQSPPQKRAAPTGKAKAVRPAAATSWVANPAVDGRDAYIVLDATSGRELYAAALDIIAWADDRGFRRLALGEHHQSSDGYLPAPLVFAAAIGSKASMRPQSSQSKPNLRRLVGATMEHHSFWAYAAA